MAGEWECSRCRVVLFDYSQVGYDGPVDRDDTSCNPFTAWEILCKECVDAEEQQKNKR